LALNAWPQNNHATWPSQKLKVLPELCRPHRAGMEFASTQM